MIASKHLTFNPGPTHMNQGTLECLEELLHSGYLAASHRSSDFMKMSEKALTGLRQSMGIPEEYHVFYQPSATVAMDTILRNLVLEKSGHFTHGAFSKRFFQTAREIGIQAEAFESDWRSAVPWREAEIPPDTELIALTHNETSTGLAWPLEEMTALSKSYKDTLIAVDVTSSFGALAMDWRCADAWFFSIQKCLGLPSGLGILLLSPRAMEKGKAVLKKRGGVAAWQSVIELEKKMECYQTPETPNMLAIALLAWIMEKWDIQTIEANMKEKAQLVYSASHLWTPYVKDPNWRSISVANLDVGDSKAWHELASEHQMTLGKGYGPLKESCIRIATFPGISLSAIHRLLELPKK